VEKQKDIQTKRQSFFLRTHLHTNTLQGKGERWKGTHWVLRPLHRQLHSKGEKEKRREWCSVLTCKERRERGGERKEGFRTSLQGGDVDFLVLREVVDGLEASVAHFHFISLEVDLTTHTHTQTSHSGPHTPHADKQQQEEETNRLIYFRRNPK
jgi:hypothetical protein